MRAGSLFGSLTLAILLQSGAALAEDCGPLQQVNTVDLVAGANRALVPLSINGIPYSCSTLAAMSPRSTAKSHRN
jgi:hypothetical protein